MNRDDSREVRGERLVHLRGAVIVLNLNFENESVERFLETKVEKIREKKKI